MAKPPEKPRVPLIFTPEELRELDDWQFEHRHRTRTAAIKALMRLGYEASKAPAEPRIGNAEAGG